MWKGDRQPLSSAVALIILVYAILAPMLINTGIADNGDFSRSIQWFIEKPAAFPTNWPPDDATWDRRFTKFWIDEWTLKPAAERTKMESGSSARLLNMAGIAANAIAGNVDWFYAMALTASGLLLPLSRIAELRSFVLASQFL